MIPGLDGLRAVAFLVLFGLHTDILQFGWVGVQFFFVLSGYLITGILLDMKEKLPVREYFIKFYGRRFLRIFPLYYFYLIMMAGLTGWLAFLNYKPNLMQVFQDQVWYALLYVYDFFSASAGFVPSRFLDHFWSLSVEEQFYIFWPLMVLLVPQKSMRNLFLGGILAGPVFRIALFLLHRFGSFSVLRDPASLFIYPLPFSHVDAFAFGAYISRFPVPNAKKQLLVIGLLIPIIGYASHYAASGGIGEISALGYPVTMPHAYQFIWAYSLLNYWFAIVLYCVVREKMFLGLLDSPPLQYLGKISYGLYVYHFPLIWFAGRIRDIEIFNRLPAVFIVLASLTATIFMASISYHLLEKPLLNLKGTFFHYE